MPWRRPTRGCPKANPDAASLLELGGGDVTVRAGHDINAGVYYVERGHGTLEAGNEIRTNSTRSPSLTTITGEYLAPETWLPTTLFLGKGSFDVSARGMCCSVRWLIPLPGKVNNSCLAARRACPVRRSLRLAVSVVGDVTLRQGGHVAHSISRPHRILQLLTCPQLLLREFPQSASYFQPWLHERNQWDALQHDVFDRRRER